MKGEILYFAGSTIDEGVGGSARLKSMLDILARLGFKTHLVTYLQRQRFEVSSETVNDLLTVTSVSVKSSLPKIIKALALPVVLFQGLKNIRRTDMIFAHAPTPATGLPGFILAKIFNKPLVIDHMDARDAATPEFIYNLVLKNSSVFAISRHLESEAKELGCVDVVYLPIFINTDVFKRDDRARDKIRKELGISKDETVIGYSGSFWYIEGVPILIEAFKQLSNRMDNIRLMLVGGRNVPGSDDIPGLLIELGLNENVILIPQQPYEIVPQYLSAFDIACSPKIDCIENRAANPVKIYEYMSMGLPTVISAVGEVANVIKNRADGYLVKPGDEKDLETVLECVIIDHASSQEAGRKAREKIENNYTQDAMVKTVNSNIRRLLNKDSRIRETMKE